MQEESKQNKIFPMLYRGAIMALMIKKFSDSSMLISGSGSWLILYKNVNKSVTWEEISRLQPFEDQHKITQIKQVNQQDDKIFVIAGTQLMIANYNSEGMVENLFKFQRSQDLILDVNLYSINIPSNKFQFFISNGHNSVQLYQNQDLKYSSICNDSSVIFCLQMNKLNKYIAAGTVFSQILVWNPVRDADKDSQKRQVIVRLKGHKGVIFRVKWIERNRIISVSDDRTVRLWKVEWNDEDKTYSGDYTQIWSQFGHRGRVWDCDFIKSSDSTLADLIVSVAQDATCKVWNIQNGKNISIFRGHQGKNVWRVCHLNLQSQNEVEIFTGGQDGSIKSWRSKFPSISSGQSQKVEQQMKNSCQTVKIYEIPMPRDDSLIYAQKNLKNFKAMIKSVLVYLDKELNSCFIYCCTNYGSVYKVIQKQQSKIGIDLTLVYQDQNYSNFTEMIKWQDDENDKKIIISHSDGVCSLIQPCSNKLIYQWKGQDLRVTNLYQINKQILLLTTGLGFFSLWKFQKKQSIQFVIKIKLQIPIKSSILGVAYHNDVLICAVKDGKVYVFNLQQSSQDEILKPVSQAQLHTFRIHALYFKEPSTFLSISKDIIKVNQFNSKLNTIQTVQSIKASNLKLIQSITPICNVTNQSGYYAYGFQGAYMIVSNTSSNQQIYRYRSGGGHRPNDAIIISQDNFYIAYSKINTLCIHVKNNEEAKNQEEDTSINIGNKIIPSFHGRQVLTSLFVKTLTNGKEYLITGGQDNLIQAHQLFVKQNGLFDLNLIQLINFHIGSVRSIKVVTTVTQQQLMFSGGGRMIVNAFYIKSNSNNSIIQHISKISLRKEQDYRIMSLDAICFGKNQNQIILVFGTTSGHLLFQRFLFEEKKWQFLNQVYCKTTILQVKLAALNDSTLIYLASGNNGKIFIGHLDLQLQLTAKPKQFLCHQMGINGLQVQILSQKNFLVLSGADDQALSAMLITFNNQQKQFGIIDAYKIEHCHESAIKDIVYSEIQKILVSSGYDQRIKTWKVMIEEEKVRIQSKNSHFHCLCDLNAMALSNAENIVCLCGQGVELFKIK